MLCSWLQPKFLQEVIFDGSSPSQSSPGDFPPESPHLEVIMVWLDNFCPEFDQRLRKQVRFITIPISARRYDYSIYYNVIQCPLFNNSSAHQMIVAAIEASSQSKVSHHARLWLWVHERWQIWADKSSQHIGVLAIFLLDKPEHHYHSLKDEGL